MVNPKVIDVFGFIAALIVGEILGLLVGVMFDKIYITTGIYNYPVGSVVTTGIVLGLLLGWLGGLVSHWYLRDYGITGGCMVGFVSATLPVLANLF
jgi:uncharacterized membrane protein YeaQ/YmgE (transglycosylase-associated protein family)